MPKLILTLSIALILCIGAVDAVKLFAADPATQPTTQPMASIKPVNTKCPVSGEAIDPKIAPIVYNGVAYGFCCEDCVKAFNKDPQKYISSAK